MITQSNNESQQQGFPLVKGKTFVVVEKYKAARDVLLNSTLSVSSLGTDNPDGIDFINCRVHYEDDFIHVGDVIEIVKNCNSLCKQSAKVIDSTEEYIVGSGFLIQKNGKFFFMENKSSIGKINFMYTIDELGNRELDQELQKELRMFVKQFNSEELECLKRAIHDDAEDEMSKFILMRNQKKEEVELFFKTNKEFLRQLDFKQDQDPQGCDFKNYSPPKGKVESYNNLFNKRTKFLKKKDRFKIAAKNFPTKFTNTKELLFWNALFECLEETYSLPENLYQTLSDKKDKKDKKDNLKPFLTNMICSSLESRNLLMDTKLNRLRVMYFIIEEPNESMFRLNTKCDNCKSEYITEEFWFGCDDNRFPLNLRTELMASNQQNIIEDLNITDEESVPSNETTGFQTVEKKKRKGRFGRINLSTHPNTRGRSKADQPLETNTFQVIRMQIGPTCWISPTNTTPDCEN